MEGYEGPRASKQAANTLVSGDKYFWSLKRFPIKRGNAGEKKNHILRYGDIILAYTLFNLNSTDRSALLHAFFFFNGHTHGIWKFPGQELNWSCTC